MKKYKLHSDYQLTDSDKEKNSGEITVIENEAYSVTELFKRYAQGLDVGYIRRPVWDKSPDIDNPDPINNPAFDLADATNELIQIEQNALNKPAVPVTPEGGSGDPPVSPDITGK